MLTRIDRIQLAVPDREAAASGWMELLGAVPAGEDRVACLSASRGRYRLGRGYVEFLQRRRHRADRPGGGGRL